MEAMVENCVLLAKMLRRALVAPRPIVDLGNSTWASPANPQLEPLSFGSLWDAKHFKRCAKGKDCGFSHDDAFQAGGEGITPSPVIASNTARALFQNMEEPTGSIGNRPPASGSSSTETVIQMVLRPTRSAIPSPSSTIRH